MKVGARPVTNHIPNTGLPRRLGGWIRRALSMLSQGGMTTVLETFPLVNPNLSLMTMIHSHCNRTTITTQIRSVALLSTLPHLALMTLHVLPFRESLEV